MNDFSQIPLGYVLLWDMCYLGIKLCMIMCIGIAP